LVAERSRNFLLASSTHNASAGAVFNHLPPLYFADLHLPDERLARQLPDEFAQFKRQQHAGQLLHGQPASVGDGVNVQRLVRAEDAEDGALALGEVGGGRRLPARLRPSRLRLGRQDARGEVGRELRGYVLPRVSRSQPRLYPYLTRNNCVDKGIIVAYLRRAFGSQDYEV
jgi:hypothetical protein